MKPLFIFCCIVLLYGCGQPNQNNEKFKIIDFSDQNKNTVYPESKDTIQKLNVAVSAMISPRKTLIYYEELFNYISKKLDCKIEFQMRKTYKEVDQMLASNELDLAFICSGAYVLDKKSSNMELLAVPVCYGKPLYQSYIIVNTSSPITNFLELKGKTFAYTDPLSNSGKFYADNRVKELGFNSNEFFSSTIYTYAHDISLQLISKGVIDGASIDGLVYEYIADHQSESLKQVKIIEKSQYFGIPPVVIRSNLKKETKVKLYVILTTLDKDPEGKKILDKLSIDKFIEGKEANYNSIKEMIRFIRE